MKHKLIQRLGAAVLAGAMLFGTLPGAPARLPVAAAVEAAAEAEGFSVAFAGSYAKVGQPMTVEVQGAASDAISYNWTVDGFGVSKDASYTPTEDDLMKWITVTVTCGSDTATAEMFFSKLPVVYINTENSAPIVSKEEYINAELVIQGNETYNSDNSTLYNGVTEIRGRGNSTWSQPKKPYRLKLDKKTDVFGMGKSKHWVLLANYMDESLQRNTLAYNLSGSMGMEQMSTVYVDVILNGDFVGNYQFCENIRVDSTRVDIFDWETFAEDSAAVIAEAEGLNDDAAGDLEDYMKEGDMSWITSGSVDFGGTAYSIADYPEIEVPSINGGYILELDEYYDEVSRFRTNSNQPIMFKNPEFVYTNKDMMSFVQNYVQAFEDAVQADSYTAAYEGETVHYSDLYDFDALVDYWLISEIFFNEEINKKSTYMYKGIDELMKMGPIWDMDWSSGGEGQTYYTDQWATRFFSANAQANNWYKFLIQDPYFFMKAQERYWEIRYAQVADMMDELDSNYELLKESAAANGERWGYGSAYEKYVDDLRNWFTDHLAWMDEQMAAQDTLRDSLGYHPSSRLDLTLTDVNGNALDADTAAKAPADGVAAEGQALKLTITGGNNTDGNAVLYVNGRRTSVTSMDANSTITVDVPSDSLTAQAGEKNVLEVQIEKADGTINASRYVTVRAGNAGETEDCEHENTVVLPAVDPTFDNTGLTEGKKCAVCGEILVRQEEVPVRDYNDGIIPLSVLIATAGDEELNGGAAEGPAALVMDDDFKTLWHTDWEGTSRDNHWIQFELTDDYAVDGLRYKPRVEGSNGTITRYDIQVSDDGENFRSVASGSWENNTDWKVAAFDAETVKYVRLVALDAVTDNPYVFASAAEIRLTGEKAGAHVHSYTAVVAAPTCTEGGYTTYTCECGDSYVADETPALGHTEQIIPGVAPTFDEPGLTDGTKCSVCDEILVQQEIAPVLDYNDGIIPLSVLEVSVGDYQKDAEHYGEGPARFAVDDDLATMWHTDWYGTSRENHWFQFELTEAYAVDGLRYKPRTTGNTNGTITEYEIQVSNDGENFETVASGTWEGDRNWKIAQFDGENVKYVRLVAVDALTDNEYVFASAAEIRLTGEKADAHAHSYTAVVTAPTCTEGGYTTYTCECGDSYVADETPALGHTEGEAVRENEKAATCTEDGSYDSVVYCTVCDAEISRETVTVPALGHTPAEAVKENVKEATCTEDGSYDSVVYCSVCDAEISRETVTFDALGHIEGEAVRENEKAATCTEDGSYESVVYCSVCDAEISRETVTVEALGHTEEVIPAVAATCTETGLTEGKKCSVCNETLVAQEEIPALGHEWKGTGCTRCDATRENPFTDVPEDSFYIDPVLWAVENGITTGATETTFDPNGNCLRGHVVTFLWRAAGEPEPTSNNNPFTDVKESDFFYKAVLWAVEEGITNGTTVTTFEPYKECNRAQVVTFLWRAMEQPAHNATESGFSDVTEPDTFYYDAVLWAVENEITNGMGDGTFGINTVCNRAQVVTFLYRTYNK